MKCFPLLILILCVIQYCDAQYDITIDGDVIDWKPESAFSAGNITCYLGWYDGDFLFGLYPTTRLNTLNVFFYFNAQPFQKFSTGSDPGNSIGITTQFGTPHFPFNTEAVARWNPTEGLKVFEWSTTNSNWTSVPLITQSANATIVEGRISNVSSWLATNEFTSVWVQFADLLTNTSTSLPGDNLAFTFPLINNAIESSWKGYVTGFPATVQTPGNLTNTAIWLGGYDVNSANSSSLLNTASSGVFSGQIRSVNVAVSNQSGISTYGSSTLKFGHDANSWTAYSSYSPYYQYADIIFDAAPIQVSTPMYIGAPARVIWRNFPNYTVPRVDMLSLFYDTTGDNTIEMEFQQDFSLQVSTLNMYPDVKLRVIVNGSSGGLNYKSDSKLIYKNSTSPNTYRTDEWPLYPNIIPHTIFIEPNLTLHTQLDLPGVLSAENIVVTGTLKIDGNSLDNRLSTENLTIAASGQVKVYTQSLYVTNQLTGATTSNIQCQTGFSVFLTDQAFSWPDFNFWARNETGGTVQHNSDSIPTIFANFLVNVSTSDSNVTSFVSVRYANDTYIGGGSSVIISAPWSSNYYILSTTHIQTGCTVIARFYISQASPSPTPSRTPSPSKTPSHSITPTPSITPIPSASTSAPSNVSNTTASPSSSSMWNVSRSPSPTTNTTGYPSDASSSSQPLLGLIALVGIIPVAAIVALIIKKRSSKQHEDMEQEMSEKLPSDRPPPDPSKPENRYSPFMNQSSDSNLSLSQVVTDSTTSTPTTSAPVTEETRTEPKQPAVRSNSLTMNWEIDYNEIKILQELGRGAFGVVYKCKWRNTECVVKQIDKENAIDLSSVLKEANNVKNIRSHPNVCQVFGVCTNPEYPICIVMEYLADGSLDNLLYEDAIVITPQRLLEFAKSIASGMSHVHKENILHCDLACRNILVEQKRLDKYVLKIADFGLSRVVETNEYKASSSSAFPIRWTAPEALRSGKISRASDIWSYGVTLWEIAEAKRPYPELSNTEVLEGVCDRGLRLPRPKRTQVPDELWELMQRCWLTPSERPSFDIICEKLEEIEEKYFGAVAVPLENTKRDLSTSDGSTSYATMAAYIRNKEM